jgi:hypothetical protein
VLHLCVLWHRTLPAGVQQLQDWEVLANSAAGQGCASTVQAVQPQQQQQNQCRQPYLQLQHKHPCQHEDVLLLLQPSQQLLAALCIQLPQAAATNSTLPAPAASQGSQLAVPPSYAAAAAAAGAQLQEAACKQPGAVKATCEGQEPQLKADAAHQSPGVQQLLQVLQQGSAGHVVAATALGGKRQLDFTVAADADGGQQAAVEALIAAAAAPQAQGGSESVGSTLRITSCTVKAEDLLC